MARTFHGAGEALATSIGCVVTGEPRASWWNADPAGVEPPDPRSRGFADPARVLRSRVIGWPSMRRKVYSIAIELTAFCNQRCDYCYNEWRGEGGQSTGDTETLLRRARRLLDAWELDHVTLTGGEPLAHPGAFLLLELFRDHGVPLQMISNGGLITEAVARRLASYDLRFVQITLNGPDAPLHEEHVGRGHFERTLAGIRACRAEGVPVMGCIVVTRKNARRVAETLELWRSLGVTQVALSRFSPAGYAARHAARLLPSQADLTEAFVQADAFGAHCGMLLSCTMPVPPCAVEVERFPHLRFGVCPIGTAAQEFALSPDGKLHNCTLHRTPLGGCSDIGDETVDLRELLDAPEVTEYRRQLPEFCAGCVHAESCGGGCGAAARWVLGSARRLPDPLVWQHVDDDLAARLERQRRDGKTHLETIL